MAVDKQGTVGPRVCGALLTVGAAVAHGLAVREFFDRTGFSPAYGVWAGFVGLALLLVGCIVGTQVDRGPTAWRPA